MNDLGQIVGYAYVGSGFTGYLYDTETHAFTEISYPGALETTPTCINNSGVIAGGFYNGSATLGFELIGSNYFQIAPKGAATANVFGITDHGALVGQASTELFYNFWFDRGAYRHVLRSNAMNASVSGVNPAGTAFVGWYNPSAGVTAGFLSDKGGLATLQFPGSMSTSVYGGNNGGEVVGRFYDASNNVHGFTWALVP